MTKLYMAVTNDEYELPLFCSTSVPEIANKFGCSVATIYSSICKQSSGRNTGRKFIKVVIDDDDED